LTLIFFCIHIRVCKKIIFVFIFKKIFNKICVCRKLSKSMNKIKKKLYISNTLILYYLHAALFMLKKILNEVVTAKVSRNLARIRLANMSRGIRLCVTRDVCN